MRKTAVGELPEGWRAASLKRALHGVNQGWSPQCENRPAEPAEWGVLKVGCVNGLTFDPTENKALPPEIEPDLSCVVRKGDVLVSRANTPELVGMAAIVEHDHPNLLLCDKLYRLRLRSDWVVPAFAVFALRSEPARRQIELGASGASSSMQNISQDVLRELSMAFPPVEAQVKIVRFLDEQTARIDALIAEKERLVCSLEDLWNSRLAFELSGGAASAQPTHYEWYPKVPANWRVVPFKHAVHFVEGPGIMAYDFRDEGVPLLRVSSVRGAQASLDGCNFLDPEKVAKTWAHFQVKEGDLLISASASMGTVSLVTKETEGAVPYTGIIILRPLPGVVTRDFIRCFVVAEQFTRQIDVLKAGATIQHFGPTHLSHIVMAVPRSLEEQAAIASRLEAFRNQSVALRQSVGEDITRLREYRSSLISAAVTGQLDISTFKAAA